MKRKLGAWKRRRKQERGGSSVKSQDSGPSHPDIHRQHGSITSTAPMHFHFTNSNCSFVMEEPKQHPGCDLTLASSSTFSGTKSWYTEANPKSSVSRRSVDAPGWVRGNESQFSSEESFVRSRAHLLSPSRVLIRHGPAPEWPPSKPTSFDSKNPTVTNEYYSHESQFYIISSLDEKENSVGKSPEVCRIQSMKRHHDPKVDTRQLDLTRKQLRFPKGKTELSCSSRSTSNPPPDFKLPRKEIRDAIKYHDRLGRALSKLALNTEINDLNNYPLGANSYTSTTLTGTSTFGSAESFRDNREVDRLGAIVRQGGQQGLMRDKHPDDVRHSNRELAIEPSFCRRNDSKVSSNDEYIVGVVQNGSRLQANSWSFSDEIQWTSSESSQSNMSQSHTSSKSNVSSFLQHVAFLEGLEDHITKFNPGGTSMDRIMTPYSRETPGEQSHESFFPSFEDLRSPPASSAPPRDPHHPVSIEIFHPPHPFMTQKADLRDVHSFSPPSTPASVFRFTRMIPPQIDGKAILQGIAGLKEETVSMLEGMESKLKLDLKELMEKEVGQIKSMLLDRSNETESPAISPSIQKGQAGASFSRMQSQSSHPHHSTIKHVMTPPPQPTTAAPSIDRNVMSELIQKTLRSMEASLLNKITLHMDRDALQQRAFIEEIIDEKVTKAMAGQTLEFHMVMDEVKRSFKQAAVRPSCEPRPPDRSNAVITPSRYQTPTKAGEISIIMSNTVEGVPTSPVLKADSNIKVLEDSFADTMKVIDDFVADCDDIVSDFDKIAFRMEDSSSIEHDYFMES